MFIDKGLYQEHSAMSKVIWKNTCTGTEFDTTTWLIHMTSIQKNLSYVTHLLSNKYWWRKTAAALKGFIKNTSLMVLKKH